MAKLLFEQIAALSQKIAGLEREIRSRTRAGEEMHRLMTIPGIGSICAMALHAFAPPMENFGCGRDFAARQVEDLLFERGIDIYHETVRYWWNRFGPLFAAEIRKRRVHHGSYSLWRWHLDEVFVRINGIYTFFM